MAVADIDLDLSLTDRVEDQIALSFYRTLYEAPATLLAVKHSFYFNETYGETPADRELLDLVGDELRPEVERHLDDEVRHAQLWRDYLEPRGEMPADDSALPFGDFIGMLRAARWLPAPERLQSGEPLSDDELMTFFAIIHVVETQAVRQMLIFRRVLRERGEVDLDELISDILRDEGRHMAYSKRCLYAVGGRTGAAGKKRAKELEQLAFRAFLRLRAGDMKKIMDYVFANDARNLSARASMKLRGLAAIIRRFPTKVPGPDGRALLDSSAPLDGARAAGAGREAA
jgi:hypothetical protein